MSVLLSEFKGNVNLSSDTSTSTTVGNTLKVNTVEAKAAADAVSLYNNATTGGITMGSALTSNLLLGSTGNTTQVQGVLVANSLNPKSASANMTIASISTNATLTVGGSMTSSGGITLGSSVSNTTVNGTLKATTINSTAVSTDLTLASDQNGGRLILADETARIGNIFIANKQGASTGGVTDGGIYIATDVRSALTSITIGTTALGTTSIRGATVNIASTGGSVNVGTGALGATDYVSIASNAGNNAASYMNLGGDSLGTTYFRSKTIDINGNGAGNTSIGSTVGTGTITLYKSITPGYLPSAITSTQIGYTVKETLTGGNLVSGVEKRIMADKTLPAGKWLICYTACLVSDAASIVTLSKAYGFDFTNDWDGINIDSSTKTITSGASGGLTFTGSFVLTSDGTEQYNVAVNITYSTGTMSYRTTAVAGINSKVTRTRIA